MRRLGTALVLLLALSLPALAEERLSEVVLADVEAAQTEDGKPLGWHYGLSLGTSMSYQHNSKVVGSPDGSNFQFGLVLDGEVGYFDGTHEWLNNLSLKETFTKTPNIDSFLKTTDSLEIASTYLYHFGRPDWLGLFGRLRLNTSVFPGYDVRDSDTDVWKDGAVDADGNPVVETVAAQDEIELTEWFEPVALRESLGLFATPLDRKQVKLHLQLGVGAQEIFTQDGYVITDDGDTPQLELTELKDYQQVGGEFELNATGALNSLVTWGFKANLFQPFYSSIERGMSGLDLLEVTIDAKLSVKLASWLSLDYVLSAKRLPLILDDWQVQNGLLLTAGFNLL